MGILREHVIAMFLGTAIGDALGAPIEGLSRKERNAIGGVTRYIPNPNHPWNGPIKAGDWTDDTQLTLVVAQSIIACGGRIDMDDMARRHVATLYHEIGWGEGTTRAVYRLEAGESWRVSGKNPGLGAGNGAAMKMPAAGVVLNRGGRDRKCDILSLAAMTHGTQSGIAAGLVQATALSWCLPVDGIPRQWDCEAQWELLEHLLADAEFAQRTMSEEFEGADVESLLFRLEHCLPHVESWMSREMIARIFGARQFHVASSLPTVWAFFIRNPTDIITLYDTVNESGDADSNGAMVGALLGAFNGLKIFPDHLLQGLKNRWLIEDVAHQLCDVLGID